MVLLTDVADALTRRGFVASVEHPGMVCILTRCGLMVSTGLHGWTYGTWNELAGDCWQPIEGERATLLGLLELKAGAFRIADDCDDAEHIAQRWAGVIVRAERLHHALWS